jgi:sugar (pentulose or hexulose) kinase
MEAIDNALTGAGLASSLPRKCSATGGTAESAFLNQMKADVLGIPVEAAAHPREAELRGLAMLAGIRGGVYSGWREAAALLTEKGKIFESDDRFKNYYDEKYQAYRGTYRALKAGGLAGGFAPHTGARPRLRDGEA